MRTSYHPEDVTILLKDITGLVQPLENQEREKFIQQGVHYSEMLPCEHAPSEAYLRTFHDALKRYAPLTAEAVGILAEKIYQEKGEDTVLVSLARAGTPVGILLKRYLEQRHSVRIKHYTISIIRGKGIDQNAMQYILHRHKPESIQFVDGWTGKGAIQRTLLEAMQNYPSVDPMLAVLSDPAHIAGKSGTYADFLIASSCLNSTVSGLISRTFYRKDIIGDSDFHGAMYYQEFESIDLTETFLSEIENYFDFSLLPSDTPHPSADALAETRQIAEHFGITDINLVKPSIGEATRVLLRRIPWKILVHSLEDTAHLGHIYQLAQEKHVPVEVYPLQCYKACGLIRNLADN
ncbi:MAG: cysteine protease StiP family protein [Oscillospiraceae bacterium]|nr:cysteine protease StiP family protein [Oscillospiraceae bacterium]